MNSKLLLEKYLNNSFKIYKNIKINSIIENFPLKFNFLTSTIKPTKNYTWRY